MPVRLTLSLILGTDERYIDVPVEQIADRLILLN